ncbi:pentraxin fusion protein-like [Palaemon carinicauda]|uniref:pentraxin fusion protein-like n=1 Tax=Palaemon carinicauda TaxID=392227 RepID=UPI0035B59092
MCTIYGADNGVYENFSFFADPEIPPVEVLEDISPSKPTYASDPYASGSPKELAVNEIYVNDDMYESKDGLVKPWWMVDLKELRTVHQVQIFTRQNFRPERLHDIEVRIGQNLVLDGDMTSYTLMSTYKGPYDVSQGHVICSNLRGVTGRYLSIQIVNSDVSRLQLVEVRVYVAKII